MTTTGINVTPVSASNVLNSSKFKNMANRVKSSGKGGNWAKGLGAAASAVSMLTNTIGNAAQLAEVPENNFQETIDDIGSTQFNTNSYDSLYNQLNNFGFAKTDYTREDMGGLSGGEAAGQIISNGLSGAMEGAAAFGPWGAFKGVGDAIAGTIEYLVGQGKMQRQAQELNYNASVANQNQIANIQRSTMDVGKNTRNLDWANIAAFGGNLDTTFTNGVRTIDEGGSHESNPIGGVPQGIAQDGLPNLVEEGEVIYKDYVYSNRLKVPQKDKEMLGLSSSKDYTYAEAAEQIQKASSERPNDPISIDTLNDMMGRLQASQEEYKAKKREQSFRKAINNMTSDELAMFMQQIAQPQQMQPMLAMQGMQPMQPTQSEMPMFAKGGILGHKHLPDITDPYSSYLNGLQETLAGLGDLQTSLTPKIVYVDNKPAIRPVEDPYNPGQTLPEIAENKVKIDNTKTSEKTSVNNPSKYSSIAQALRMAPVFGSLAGAINSIFDKPNYSNIERAENAMRAVPRVGAGHVGQRLKYEPIDINYIATQMANQGLGARRALNEYGAINPAGTQQAVIANNYAGQTSLADAIMKANQLNRQNLAQSLEFNRGTNTINISNDLQSDLANQQRDEALAQFLFQTGQLRDAELGRIQTNRSTNLTNLSQQLGNLGTDMFNRDMAKAMAESYGVTYNDVMNALLSKLSAYGGKLNTKKGGKHA